MVWEKFIGTELLIIHILSYEMNIHIMSNCKQKEELMMSRIFFSVCILTTCSNELKDADLLELLDIEAVELTEGKKILLGKKDGDRLIIVQLVTN